MNISNQRQLCFCIHWYLYLHVCSSLTNDIQSEHSECKTESYNCNIRHRFMEFGTKDFVSIVYRLATCRLLVAKKQTNIALILI